MLTRLKQVLGGDDQDEITTEVLRRFWTRLPAKALPVRPPPARDATVVDLAQWVHARRDAARR